MEPAVWPEGYYCSSFTLDSGVKQGPALLTASLVINEKSLLVSLLLPLL